MQAFLPKVGFTENAYSVISKLQNGLYFLITMKCYKSFSFLKLNILVFLYV